MNFKKIRIFGPMHGSLKFYKISICVFAILFSVILVCSIFTDIKSMFIAANVKDNLEERENYSFETESGATVTINLESKSITYKDSPECITIVNKSTDETFTYFKKIKKLAPMRRKIISEDFYQEKIKIIIAKTVSLVLIIFGIVFAVNRNFYVDKRNLIRITNKKENNKNEF